MEQQIFARWMSGEEVLTACGMALVLIEILIGIVPGDLLCSEQSLPFPSFHPCESTGFSRREYAALVERKGELLL